jgi:hypothetical protein
MPCSGPSDNTKMLLGFKSLSKISYVHSEEEEEEGTDLYG